jgi:uncharacterized protein YciI
VYFIIVNTDKPGQNALRLATRPVQHAYLDGFAERIPFAGPTVTEDASQSMGNLIVFEADSYADAEAFARADPYAKAGLFDTTCIRPWKCTFGRLMEQA